MIGDTHVALADARVAAEQPESGDQGAVPVQAPTESGDSEPKPPAVEPPIEEAEARPGIERDEALETPEAIAEREQSQYAYADIGPEQTEALLRERFAPQLKQIDADPSRALADVALESVASPTEALVTVEGEKALLESTVPVRVPDEDGKMAKVDLGLEQTETGFAPKNSLADVSLPANASGAIEVGDVALRLAVNGEKDAVPPDARAAGAFGEEGLVLPDVAEDTSLLLSPVTGGVELSALILSRRSPEQLSFAVEMPAGAQLDPASDGGAEVIGGEKGDLLARIGAPFAVDAQGTVVPVSLVVKGSSIVLDFPHRSMDIAYPLYIDPEIEENWSGFADTSKLNYWQWQYSGVGSEDYIGWRSCIVHCWGNGLYLRSRSNFSYPGGSFGRWWFVPQGSTTYMRRVIFGPMNLDGHGCWANEPHGYAGVWNNGGFWSVHAPATPSGVTTWVDTGEQNLGAGARTAFVGLHANGTVKLTCGRDYAMGGAVLFLNDPEDPSVSASGYPTGWVKDNSPFTINVPVYDPGLGVKSATISPKDSPPLSTKELGCTGHYNSQCPASDTFQFTLSADSFDQGEKEVQVSAKDAMAKTSNTFPFMMKVDRTPPDVTLGGQLATATKEAEGEAKDPTDFDPLRLPVYNLTIKAEDGVENGTAAQRRSGVKSIEVFLDKEKTPRESWTQAACSNSCGMSKTFTLKLNEVTALTHHTLKVVVNDQAGNTPREREIEFEYVPATGMKEEYVLHYFPLPNGQGDEDSEEDPVRPELAVNVMNGNLVYRQVDVDVSGPAADLEVERYYNSLLPESQDTEWGDGWMLAQTPVLETEAPEGSPSEATLVEESGAVESQVELPEQIGEERFDDQLQAVISKEATGYEVTDESGEGEGTLIFNEAGEATELEASEYAGVEYSYDGDGLSKIAVDDVASVGGNPGRAADREALEDMTPALKSTSGTQGTANGEFKVLTDIAIDPTDGTAWVSDDENNRVQHLSATGDYLGQFSGCPDPAAVLVEAQGNVYVACAEGVKKFSDAGTLLETIATRGYAEAQVGFVTDMALDSEEGLWVASHESGEIKHFDAEGDYVDSFSTGTALERPWGIAVSEANEVYVTQPFYKHRVAVFDEEGDLLRTIGSQGAGEGQFDFPSDVEIDEHGFTWVADARNDRVQIFNEAGEYLTQFGSPGSGPGQLDSDWWLRLDVGSEGNVFVTDQANHRVQAWRAPGRLMLDYGVRLQDDPSLKVNVEGGLVARVKGREAGVIDYQHDDDLLSAVEGPEGETSYEYDEAGRMTKVEMPNGTYAEIAYEATYGRVKSVTASIEGASPKTTNFNYEDQPQRRTTVTPPAPDPVTTYEFATDGSMLKWWNTKQPPTLDDVGGTLHDIENRETASPITPGLYNLTVQASSAHGIASIQVVANNNTLVSERTCAQVPGPPVECEKETDEWVLETGNFAPGMLYLEVIATNVLGESASERFWVNIPYAPPADPEAEEPPKFADVLKFREEFGLDLDVKGNEEAINDRVFNLIGNWHNPHTLGGEIAWATMERWGAPLRPVDVAELEYRDYYIPRDTAAIMSWGASHPSGYAGYYVDHRAGGIINVALLGSKEQQETLFASLSSGLVAPARAAIAPGLPVRTQSQLGSIRTGVVAEMTTHPLLIGEVGDVSIDVPSNRVVVSAANSGQAESILTPKFGAGVKVIQGGRPLPMPAKFSRYNHEGPVQAGDYLFSTESACSAGFGAWDTADGQTKDNGQAVYVPLQLTAGHCFLKGEKVGRGYPKESDLGRVTRSIYAEDPAQVSLDGETIKSSWPEIASTIFLTKNTEKRVTGYETPVVGQWVCASGVTTNNRVCGPVLDEPKEAFSEAQDGSTIRSIEIPVGARVSQGDSGGPAWVMGTGNAAGLITGAEDSAYGYPECTDLQGGHYDSGIDENYICPIVRITTIQQIVSGAATLYNAAKLAGEGIPLPEPLYIGGVTVAK